MGESRWMTMKCGRPATAVHNENDAKVRVLLAKQPYLTLQAIAKELNVGKNAIRTMLIEKMNC